MLMLKIIACQYSFKSFYTLWIRSN
jgi:hypothetical protein